MVFSSRRQAAKLALPLLQAGVLLVNDEPLATSADDLAILGPSLDAAFNFHSAFTFSVFAITRQCH
jgi:hypothetical protein